MARIPGIFGRALGRLWGPGRVVVALLSLGVVASLVPLAHANPPDPTWFAGFYDDGDHDDAVLLAMSTAGTLGGTTPLLARLDRCPVERFCRRPASPATVILTADPTRGPPAP